MFAQRASSASERTARDRENTLCDLPLASPRPCLRNDVLLLAVEGLDSESMALTELILDDHRARLVSHAPPDAFSMEKNR